MLITEFRVLLPLTVEEYQVGQLFSVAEASKNETGGGEGIEVLKNEPYKGNPLCGGQYDVGQYTLKMIHLQSKVPNFIRFLFSKALDIQEEAWNAYPYCRTVITNPGYMKDNAFIKIETMHAQDAGTQENAHNLPPNLLEKRKVVFIDIANNAVIKAGDYKPDEDPSKFQSVSTGRGPLTEEWQRRVSPLMCAYKLVTAEFKWFGLQSKVESFIMTQERRLFTNFHRQVFCWIDRWHGMTMEDIRALEDKTKTELEKQLNEGEVRGTKATDKDA